MICEDGEESWLHNHLIQTWTLNFNIGLAAIMGGIAVFTTYLVYCRRTAE